MKAVHSIVSFAARDPQELRRQMAALRGRQEEAIAAILTDAQREVWARLTEWDD